MNEKARLRYEKNKKRYNELGKKWRENNKEKSKEYNAQYRKENKEYLLLLRKDWVSRNEDHVKEYLKIYNSARKLKMREWREANRERIAASNRAWKTANRDKVRMYDHLKRIRKNNAAGSCSPEQWEARFNYHGRKCRYCHCILDDRTVQIEHMIPLRHGGSNWPSNLVPSCKFCNTSKKDKTYKQFIRYIKENPRLFDQGFYT